MKLHKFFSLAIISTIALVECSVMAEATRRSAAQYEIINAEDTSYAETKQMCFALLKNLQQAKPSKNSYCELGQSNVSSPLTRVPWRQWDSAEIESRWPLIVESLKSPVPQSDMSIFRRKIISGEIAVNEAAFDVPYEDYTDVTGFLRLGSPIPEDVYTREFRLKNRIKKGSRFEKELLESMACSFPNPMPLADKQTPYPDRNVYPPGRANFWKFSPTSGSPYVVPQWTYRENGTLFIAMIDTEVCLIKVNRETR